MNSDERKRRTLTDAYNEMVQRSRRLSDGFADLREPTDQCTLESLLPRPKQYNIPGRVKKQVNSTESKPTITNRLLKRPEAISSVLKSAKKKVSRPSKTDDPETEADELASVAEVPVEDDEDSMEVALEKLNEAAAKMFPDDPLTDGSPRWVLEPGFLRGYMAVWTIQRGADLVQVVATAMTKTDFKQQPDITLQWVGRQLWGLTIQIPRLRSGAINDDHIKLALYIDSQLALSMTNNQDLDTGTEETGCLVHPVSTNQSLGSIKVPEEKEEEEKAPVVEQPSENRGLNEKNLRILRSASSTTLTTCESGHSPPGSPSSTTSTFRSLTGVNSPITNVEYSYEDPFEKCIPEKTGWLRKKSGRTSWQRRWFELKGNRLYYFASEQDGIPRGAIVLDRVKVRLGENETENEITITAEHGNPVRIMKFTNRLTHQTHNRKSYTLRSETPEEANEWVEAASRAAIFCHLSLPLSPERKSVFTLTDKQQQPPRVQRYGSIRYLRETDPLLWEINPLDQMAIKKRASQARTRSEYATILSKYSHVFREIVLPPPRPISMEQTLRDIEPEAFLINNVLYGGHKFNLDCVFEVLESYVKRFTVAHDERVNFVSAILHASARTIGGGDTYFVVRSLLGNPSMLIRPSQLNGVPIEIDISTQNPSEISVTIVSLFSLHHIDAVDQCDSGFDDEEPVLRIRALHVQEFDFKVGKCRRSLSLTTERTKDSDTMSSVSDGIV